MKSKIPENSIFRKKGFFAALYSCVGVVLVLAAIISYNNIRALTNPPGSIELSDSSGDIESADVNADITKPYLSQSNGEGKGNTAKVESGAETAGSAAQPNKPQLAPYPDGSVQAAGAPEIGQALFTEDASGLVGKASPTPGASPSAKPVPNELSPKGASNTATDGDANTAGADTDNEGGSTEANADSGNGEVAVAGDEPVFPYFTDDQYMSWPVLGEVVLGYSVDHVIYDPTLDHYRTNDNICIAAQPGASVKASAAGVVKEVKQTRKDGNVVVIDDGNGWITTYGQLMDGVLVKEGDIVKAGQVIGGVSGPTVYGVLLGSHLSFKVTKDDTTINPIDVLVKE